MSGYRLIASIYFWQFWRIQRRNYISVFLFTPSFKILLGLLDICMFHVPIQKTSGISLPFLISQIELGKLHGCFLSLFFVPIQERNRLSNVLESFWPWSVDVEILTPCLALSLHSNRNGCFSPLCPLDSKEARYPACSESLLLKIILSRCKFLDPNQGTSHPMAVLVCAAVKSLQDFTMFCGFAFLQPLRL